MGGMGVGEGMCDGRSGEDVGGLTMSLSQYDRKVFWKIVFFWGGGCGCCFMGFTMLGGLGGGGNRIDKGSEVDLYWDGFRD